MMTENIEPKRMIMPDKEDGDNYVYEEECHNFTTNFFALY
jgi:hypothetical protein